MLKVFFCLFISMSLFTSPANAKSIRTPEGNFPRVQWAIVEATAGNLEKISEIGARVLASTSAKESGTYALYGAVEKENPDLIRLLEIYESDEAYRIHSTSGAFQQYRAERFQFLKDLKLIPVNAIALEQKDSGVGKFVITVRYEVKATDLAEFQNLMAIEYIRAVKDFPGALGMFLTVEKSNPNIFHTMEIFEDDSAYKKYTSSAFHRNLKRKTQNMIQHEKITRYLPAKILLTQKGSRT